METVRTPDDRFEALPDRSCQAAALIFPSLVTAAAEGGEATKLFTEAWRVLEGWEKPLLTAYGKADPVLGWADKLFQRCVPGAEGQPHVEFPDGVSSWSSTRLSWSRRSRISPPGSDVAPARVITLAPASSV